jgi:hypothetical protein
MAVTLQHLRTSTPTQIPLGLAAGQIAFNLANGWVMVGNGGDDILVKGVAVPTYSTTTTIFGVANVHVPAKPTARGYEVFQLSASGVSSGVTRPTGAAVGQVFVDTSVSGKPAMVVWNGTAWMPPVNPPSVYALSDTEYTAGAGSGVDAKALAALTGKSIGSKPAGTAPTFNSGDTLIIGGSLADSGTYIYNGSGWTKSGGNLPDATDRGTAGTAGTKGVVYLARGSDVQPAAQTGATTPDPLAVATGAQLKSLSELVSSLVTGTTLLGTYDASTGGEIATPSSSATAGTPARSGFIAGGKISAGSNMKVGDYFLVIKGGTPTGDVPAINLAVNANDHVVYDGAAWHLVASGVVASAAFSINAASDFDTDTVATVAPTDQRGLLVRDGTVAAGVDKAWKLVDTIDAGTF